MEEHKIFYIYKLKRDRVFNQNEHNESLFTLQPKNLSPLITFAILRQLVAMLEFK